MNSAATAPTSITLCKTPVFCSSIGPWCALVRKPQFELLRSRVFRLCGREFTGSLVKDPDLAQLTRILVVNVRAGVYAACHTFLGFPHGNLAGGT
jgi:hypothetical protein